MPCLNKDDALRQSIMGIKAVYGGGIYHFDKFTLTMLNSLIENGFVNLDDRQNYNAPTIREFWELIKKYPKEPITLGGYIVEPERDDYRISIDELEGKSHNKKFICDFQLLCYRYPRGAIKIFPNYQYCWYD